MWQEYYAKKWMKLLISGRNGGSNFLHPPIGGRHRLLYFRTNIKATNMKEIQQGNLLEVVTPYIWRNFVIGTTTAREGQLD